LERLWERGLKRFAARQKQMNAGDGSHFVQIPRDASVPPVAGPRKSASDGREKAQDPEGDGRKEA